MNILLFFVAIIISFVVVRIGAIAFELTGLEWSLAKFQALSCFSGTGFTTKEAELITGNAQRRRIASVLMVLGNAGLVTLVATFANSLRPAIRLPKWRIPFLPLVFPTWLLPWINLLLIVAFLIVMYRLLTRTKMTKRVTAFLRRHLIKKDIIKTVSFEELVVSTGGYGVSRFFIEENTPIINKTIRDSELRKMDINILVIERGKDIIPNPQADTKVLLGDNLVCFGKLESIKKALYKR